jgi:predicted GNAT superfamily acetyltransferase
MEPVKKIHVIDDRSLLDKAAVLSLNNLHAKETSALDDRSLAGLLEMSFYARGMDRGATAFLIALDQDASYRNPNFDWFKDSRESFIYIDRIIVAASARGQGLATRPQISSIAQWVSRKLGKPPSTAEQRPSATSRR